MKKNKIKKNHSFYIGIFVGLSIFILIGIIIASNLISHNNSFFARIRVAIKKKVQIVYNYNLFDANTYNNKAISNYDKDSQTITLDGKLEGESIQIGLVKSNKLNKGDKYRITINYVSGSYSSAKNEKPVFIFDLQKDKKYYENRKNDIHYLKDTLPTKGKSIDKVITINDETKDANYFLYRIYQSTSGNTTFNKYRIQLFVTKIESKIGVAGEKYGSLTNISKDGYDFLGWYDEIKGGKKITDANTILKKYNHTLYAHWSPKKYKISFNLNDGTGDNSSINATYGELLPKLNRNNPTKEGYEFLGWFDSNNIEYYGSNGTSKLKYTLTSNLTLNAKWKENLKKPKKPTSKYVGACENKTSGGKYKDIPYLNENEYCSFESDSLKYYIEQQKYHRITYIWAKDPYNQMKVAISEKDTDGTYKKQYSTDIIKREIKEKKYSNKGLIGVNASAMIPWGDASKDAPRSWKGQPRLNLFINDGKIIRYEPNTYWFHHRHYGLTKSGWLKDYFMGNTKDLERAEKMKKAIIADGVKYTFGWFKPLVRNGKVAYDPNNLGDYNSTNMILSICQFDENNFAIFSSSTSARTREYGAISYKEEADLLLKLGCKYAFSLDSGGSTSFFYKSRTTTLNGPGKLYDHRIIADVLYFVEQ
jgi:uncharacterized repeat protein (TIGR02543 family)